MRISGVAGPDQVGRPGRGPDPILGRLGDADVIDRAAPTAPDLDDDRQHAVVVYDPQRRPQRRSSANSIGGTTWNVQLQWGRGCVATEIRRRTCGVLTPRVASMGPWLCSHGNSVVRSSLVCGLSLASMGPWLCSHGNFRPFVKGIDWLASFNGAVAV